MSTASEQAGDSRWCILRTSAQRTLPLARSLAAAGYDVWTPTATVRSRTPRVRDRQERPAPMMPTFVFARAEHLADLLRDRVVTGDKHPPFSVFRYAGRFPLIGDRDIHDLRFAEEKMRVAVLRTKKHPITIGQEVRPTEGAFAGMSGVVEEAHGKYALVCFSGSLRIKIEAWQLPDNVAQAA